MLADVARLVRAFNVLLYASVTTRFAPLRTPKGLAALVERGLLTDDEREALLQSSKARRGECLAGWVLRAAAAISDWEERATEDDGLAASSRA